MDNNKLHHAADHEVEINFNYQNLNKTDDGYEIVKGGKSLFLLESVPCRMTLINDSLYDTLLSLDKNTIDNILYVKMPGTYNM